jgi:ribosomal protein S6E (S10)
MKRYEFLSVKKHNIGSQGKRIFIFTLLFFWFMGLHEHLIGDVSIPPDPVTLSWSERHMTYMNVSLNGKGNSLVVNPGEEVKITFNWQLKVDNGTIYCPGCIVQFYYGIKDTFSNCLFSDVTPPGFEKSDTVSATFKAPMTSGVYYITQVHTLLYNCKPEPGKHSNDFKDAFAVITVRKNIYFLIKSRLNGYVLGIEKGSNKRGAPIVVYPQKGSGTDDQLWTVTEDGYIKSRLNDYVLDIKGGSTQPGTPIIAYSQNPGGLNQQWKITEDGYIKSKMNGYVLDIKGGSTQPGTPIIAFPQNTGAMNQQWDFSMFRISS